MEFRQGGILRISEYDDVREKFPNAPARAQMAASDLIPALSQEEKRINHRPPLFVCLMETLKGAILFILTFITFD